MHMIYRACLLLLTGFIFIAAASAQQRCLQQASLSTAPSIRFVREAEGAVKDLATDLVWRTCLEGQAGEQCAGEALALNWAQALMYPHQLNQGKKKPQQWRLPNIRELNTLVELRCIRPAINSGVFQGIVSNQVWTSSPYQFYTHYAWYVDFDLGGANYDERVKNKALLLVRGGN